MFELPMAAAGGDKHPARTLQCLDQLPYLHLNALVTSKNNCLLARERSGPAKMTSLKSRTPWPQPHASTTPASVAGSVASSCARESQPLRRPTTGVQKE